MRKFIAITASLLLSFSLLMGQNADEQISTAIKLSNYKELSKYFDTKVDLTIVSKENSYSRSQAELIVKDFFTKNHITDYQVIHRGSSRDGAKYAIGTLSTSGRTYRTYVLTKDVNGQLRIQQLRFETGQ